MNFPEVTRSYSARPTYALLSLAIPTIISVNPTSFPGLSPGTPLPHSQDIPTSLPRTSLPHSPGHPYLTPRTSLPHSQDIPTSFFQATTTLFPGHPNIYFLVLAASTGIPTSFISRRLGQTPPIVLLFHMFSHSPSNSAVVVGSGGNCESRNAGTRNETRNGTRNGSKMRAARYHHLHVRAGRLYSLDWTGLTQKSVFQCRTEAKHTYLFTKVACIALLSCLSSSR